LRANHLAFAATLYAEEAVSLQGQNGNHLLDVRFAAFELHRKSKQQ